MVIAHNIFAMNAQRQLNIVTKNKEKTTEKLSSGYRINRAADDAAGLSISEKMRRQIRGLSQGIRNTEDGVSLCQVADGALAEVSNMLHRITELSVQSANGTNSDEDRKAIQQEISQIMQEIDRIGGTTEFNEKKIFGGGELPKSYYPPTVSTLGVTGVPTDTTAMSYNITADNSGFKINGDSFTWSDFRNGGNTLGDTPIQAGIYTFDYHGLTLSLNAENNSRIEDLIGRMNGASFETENGSYTTKMTASVQSIEGGIAPAPDGRQYYYSHMTELPSCGYVSFKVHENASYNGVSGDFIEFVDDNGNCVNDDLGWICLDTGTIRDYGGGFYSSVRLHGMKGPFAVLYFTENTKASELVDMLDGAILTYDTSTLETPTSVITPSNEKNWWSRVAITGLQLSPAKVYTSGVALGEVKQTNYKGIEIQHSQQEKDNAPLNLWIQSGSEAGQGMFLGIDRMNTSILGINDLDASTVDGANHALDAVKGALEKVSTNRSKIGAQQNRLEHTIANEQNVVENTTSAESRIRDTDMAKEMVEFSKGMILENVGQAMLAQANQSNQGVLSLLQ